MVHMGFLGILPPLTPFSIWQLCICWFLPATVLVIVLGVLSVGGWKEGIRTGTAEEVINTASSRVF